MTAVEQERYAELGIESPRVHWGDPPGAAGPRPRVQRAGRARHILLPRRLHVEAQAARASPCGVPHHHRPAPPAGRQVAGGPQGAEGRAKAARSDRRIELIAEDLPTDEHLRLFASADVCLAPSRWEGLGLHLYEATALGLPIITNDNPPMNEVVGDERNGLLVGRPSPGRPLRHPGVRPDVAELAAAIARLADPELRARLAAGAEQERERLAWSRTVADLGELLTG